MKKTLLFLSTCLTLLSFGTSFTAKETVEEGPKMSFTENKGQISDQSGKARADVLFTGMTSDLAFHLRKTGISYQFTKVESWKNDPDNRTRKDLKVPDRMSIYRLDIEWEGAKADAAIERGKMLPGHENFYLAACPGGITGVHAFEAVTYKNIYSGTDLRYYKDAGQLKYDFILLPGADPAQIKGHVTGANKIFINKEGDLVMETSFGVYSEKAPLVKQGDRIIPSRWQVNGNYISYHIGAYDPAKSLIIDPMTRVWGTFYGGYYSIGHACATDATGNVYMSGWASSPSSIIATTGSHQYAFGGGVEDGYLVKFDPTGARLWATYYGGNSSDRFYDCALDASGNIYATGVTPSPSGIASAGAHQTTILGNGQDCFLVKFDNMGVRQWGTYYGGNSTEWAFGCCTDNAGDVYICGIATSTNGSFIATASGHQPVMAGVDDAFLAKFSAAGVRLWGTYYGGTLTDCAYGCSTDPAGNVYIAGQTKSTGGIGTAGTEQPNFLGGYDDCFLAKFNSSGVRQWGTYYGSNSNSGGYDAGYACATAGNGALYMVGVAASGYGGTMTPVPVPSPGSLIATPGSHQPLPSGDVNDGFLVKFDPATGLRIWGTYFGNGSQYMNCATNTAGNILLCGAFGSTLTITTPGSYQTVFGGGYVDAYISEFSPAGSQLWGSLYGGPGWEEAFDCDYDAFGNCYLTGLTLSNTTNSIIATPGSYQPLMTPGNNGNAYLAKFSFCSLPLFSIAQTNIKCNGAAGGSATLTATTPPLTANWSNGFTGPVVSNLPAGGFTCTVTNTCGASVTQVVNIMQPPAISITAGPAKQVICKGNLSTLSVQATGGTGILTYSWTPLSVAGPTASASPTANAIYTVIATDANGCVMTANITQSVNTCVAVSERSGISPVKFFPNPASGEIFIESAVQSHLLITDLSGRIIREVDLVAGNNRLDVSDLAVGCYVVETTSGDEINRWKLVKE